MNDENTENACVGCSIEAEIGDYAKPQMIAVPKRFHSCSGGWRPDAESMEVANARPKKTERCDAIEIPPDYMKVGLGAKLVCQKVKGHAGPHLAANGSIWGPVSTFGSETRSPCSATVSEIVSWWRFCEWVQGKRPIREEDEEYSTIVDFEDGSSAAFYSNRIAPEAGGDLEPPNVVIEEIR